jgi:hypothetical protein
VTTGREGRRLQDVALFPSASSLFDVEIGPATLSRLCAGMRPTALTMVL